MKASRSSQQPYLVGRPCMESQDAGAPKFVCLRIALDCVLWRDLLPDQVRVEDVEFVPLHHLHDRGGLQPFYLQACLCNCQCELTCSPYKYGFKKCKQLDAFQRTLQAVPLHVGDDNALLQSRLYSSCAVHAARKIFPQLLGRLSTLQEAPPLSRVPWVGDCHGHSASGCTCSTRNQCARG